jgi:uncharacterized membrane protein
LKISFKQDLPAINILLLVLIIFITLCPTVVIRAVIGLPFVLFFPGYVLLAVLYPRKDSISGIRMTAMSFGLSLAIIPIIGLILNYTSWGITLNSELYSLTAFIMVMSAAAWWRRRRLPLEERYRIEFSIDLSGGWGPGVMNKLLTIALAAAVLGTIATAAYVIARPKTGECFTEFYILGSNGKAQDYPRHLLIGEKTGVTVGIVNHEHTAAGYRVEVTANNTRLARTGPVALAHEEKWEEFTPFSLQNTGTYEVDFYIYRDNGDQPYLKPLRLWIEVAGD